jgi:hypothetical protein
MVRLGVPRTRRKAKGERHAVPVAGLRPRPVMWSKALDLALPVVVAGFGAVTILASTPESDPVGHTILLGASLVEEGRADTGDDSCEYAGI